MTIRRLLSKTYRWGLSTFIYNDINERLFFSKGFSKTINNEKIRVPFKFSSVYPKVYEPEKTDFIQAHCKKGDVVIDIGAHMGMFTFFMARQVGTTGKVFSFEPAPLTYKILQQTIKYNHLNNIVETYQKAVSNNNNDLTFYIYNNSKISSGNSLSPNNPAGASYGVKVKTITLDQFFNEKKLDRLDFIKIDAEGGELDILKGGKKVIQQYKPYITLEVHPRVFVDKKKEVMKEIFDTISSYGYKINNGEYSIMSEETFCNHADCFEVVLIP